jgi:hypothetical protein
VTGRGVSFALFNTSANPGTRPDASTHLPERTLIAISQHDAALTNTLLLRSLISARILEGSSEASVNHQTRTCVSRRILTDPRHTRASTPPRTSARTDAREP